MDVRFLPNPHWEDELRPLTVLAGPETDPAPVEALVCFPKGPTTPAGPWRFEDWPAADRELLALADELLDKVRGHYDATAMHLALEAIWSMLGAANRYFSAQEPWVLRKTDPARFATVLYTTLEVVRIAALLSQPVMPTSMAKLLSLLGQPEDQRAFAAIATRLAPGTALPAPSGVFPRYQAD